MAPGSRGLHHALVTCPTCPSFSRRPVSSRARRARGVLCPFESLARWDKSDAGAERRGDVATHLSHFAGSRRAHQALWRARQALERAHPALGRAHPALGRAHEVLGRAHEVLGRAHQVLGRAHEVLGRPHEVLGRPHEVLGRAHEVLGRAHQAVGRAHQAVGRAHPVLRRARSPHPGPPPVSGEGVEPTTNREDEGERCPPPKPGEGQGGGPTFAPRTAPGPHAVPRTAPAPGRPTAPPVRRAAPRRG